LLCRAFLLSGVRCWQFSGLRASRQPPRAAHDTCIQQADIEHTNHAYNPRLQIIVIPHRDHPTTHKPPTTDAMARTTNSTTVNIAKASTHNHVHPVAYATTSTTHHQQQPPNQHNHYDQHNQDDPLVSSKAMWRQFLTFPMSACYNPHFGVMRSLVVRRVETPCSPDSGAHQGAMRFEWVFGNTPRREVSAFDLASLVDRNCKDQENISFFQNGVGKCEHESSNWSGPVLETLAQSIKTGNFNILLQQFQNTSGCVKVFWAKCIRFP
jgi:hypothetical protein